jgi:hypothetical protein
MEVWYCFKDKVRMADVNLKMLYLKKSATIGGLKCPKCGVSYLVEDTVTRRVSKAEQMIEKK